MTADRRTRASRKVAVLGPIPRDQILTHAGERFEKYGCALYTAVALSALLDPDDTIAPITHVRRRDEDPIKKILSAYPNIDTSGITSAHDQGDVVELRYIEHNRRAERQTSFMNPILPGDLDEVLDANVFVCVPITDYEVSQPTLRHIKEHNSSAIIVLDGHGPTTTLTRSGERHPRVWADRDVWLPHIDILKMNLEEASSTWLGEAPELIAGPSSLSHAEVRDLAPHRRASAMTSWAIWRSTVSTAASVRSASPWTNVAAWSSTAGAPVRSPRRSSIASRSGGSSTRPAPVTPSPPGWVSVISNSVTTSSPASTAT